MDFETPDADLLMAPAGAYEGKFCKVLGYGNERMGYHATTDEAQMRRVLLEAPALVGFRNYAFDLIAAAQHLKLPWWPLVSKSRDVYVEARLAVPPTHEVRGQYSLDTLSGGEKSEALVQLRNAYGSYDKIPDDHPNLAAYVIQDVKVTEHLARTITPPDPAYVRREREVAGIAGELCLRGVRVDTDLLDRRLPEEAARLDAVRRRLIDEWGFPEYLPIPKRNPRPAAKPWLTKVGRTRFAQIVDPYGDWPQTKKGLLSTEASVLRSVAEEYPDTPIADLAGLILEMTSTSLPKQVAGNLVEGRVHPSYGITTATGRWASARPNILGVGKRNTTLLADRDLFVADPGNVFASVDLSGIDARCVAGLSGDVEYAKLFEPGRDVHTEMATAWFGSSTKENRAAAKSITHGIAYGRQPKAIAKMTGRPIDEVVALHKDYFTRFSKIAEWHSEIRSEGSDGVMLPTGSGRHVRVAPESAFTEAPARLAQSAARDLAMDGLINLKDDGLLENVALFVHDEVVVQGPPDEIEELAARVVDCMSFDWNSPSGLVIPIVAAYDGHVGPRWSDCY